MIRRGFTPEEREETRKADAEIEREFKQPRYIRRLKKALQKEPEKERKAFVTIRSGRKKIKLDTRSYWQIVGETQFFGETRIEAVDAAKWCLHAKPGQTRTLPNGTTMEVSEEWCLK